MNNITCAPARQPRKRVVYLKGWVEHQTAWFTNDDRTRRAFAVICKRYGAANAIIVRD